MDFKPNTIIVWTNTNLAIKRAWEQACQEIIGVHYIPTCTSGADGEHSPDSGHYYGRALDFRKYDIAPHFHEALTEKTQSLLGSDYLVINEDNHFHVQRNKNSFT